MHLSLTTCAVRSWQPADAGSLVTYANNRKIWMNLRDRFPHPYSKRDALDFLRSVCGRQPETAFAIAGRTTVSAATTNAAARSIMETPKKAAGHVNFKRGRKRPPRKWTPCID